MTITPWVFFEIIAEIFATGWILGMLLQQYREERNKRKEAEAMKEFLDNMREQMKILEGSIKEGSILSPIQLKKEL